MTDAALATLDAMDENDSKGVVIDLAGLSFKDSMDMTILQSKMTRLTLLNARLKMDDAPASVLDEMIALSSPSMMDELFKQGCNQFSRVVISLPRDWFVRGAPGELPLDQPSSYEWLRADKAKELRQMISNAQEKAKN